MRAELQRITGALLGGAVGDALGWPMELRGSRVGGTARISPEWRLVAWERREGGSYGPHRQPVEAGAVSDDTQLSLAVARSVLHRERWWSHFTEIELPLWTVYERGGGGATKRAARTWLRGVPPWDDSLKLDAIRKYFHAGGNGTAMRCLPHCIIANEWSELRNRLDRDAATTHGHPRALIGSRVFGWCAHQALRRAGSLRYGELLEHVVDAHAEWGEPPQLWETWHAAARTAVDDYESEWHRVVNEAIGGLEVARSGIHEGAVAIDAPILDQLGALSRSGGAGTVTAVASIFLATRYLSQPQQGTMSAAFARGADTDTLASMTGGLLGALTGPDWLLPLARHVQDFAYVRELAQQLEARAEADPIHWRFTAGERSRFYRWLDRARPGHEAQLPPFGTLRVTDITDYEPHTQFVRQWSLETEIGQSLMVKRYDKGRDGRPRWRSTRVRPGDHFERSASSADPSIAGTPSAESQDDAAGRRRDQPRVGTVLKVGDIKRAASFYTQVVGLDIQRATDRYVSFGWLALEPDERVAQLSSPPDLQAVMPTIRIYITVDRLAETRALFDSFGLVVEPLDVTAHSGFRSFDPDGHPIEVLLRSSS